MNDFIEIKNARTHNLKGISLKIPKNKIVAFTGVSGSGKSSLVFDTLYTEAQRQLIETFSTFARRRLPKLSRPDVDEIRNLATAIVIDQKRLGRNMRSTVGTATDIYTYLRMLFSRCGDPFIGFSHVFSFNHPDGMCPDCRGLGRQIHIDSKRLLDHSLSLKEGAIIHPEFKLGGWNWKEIINSGLFDPYKPLNAYSDDELQTLLYAKGIEVEQDIVGESYRKRFEGVITKLERVFIHKEEDELPDAKKDAYQKYLIYSDCKTCDGNRLNKKALTTNIKGFNIAQLSEMELTKLDAFLIDVDGDIATPLVSKMRSILRHLIDIGVGYLTLNRGVSTLSGGESQRIKMARQLDCDLTGLMYVLDEPSIGLHARDNAQLIKILQQLRDKGNTVLVVEHDPDIIVAADYVIDIGPEAGSGGGSVCFSGDVEALKQSNSLTGSLLNKKHDNLPNRRVPKGWFEINNATLHNLKDVSVNIPKGVLTCISGVAGSGKSTLIHDVFIQQEKGAIVIDQNPVGKTSRSNPMTYTGMFDLIRKTFAEATGASPALFSFNSKGACPTCKGQGYVKVEMNFMDDIKIECSDCKGQRYIQEVLDLKYQGKNIFDCLCMTIKEASSFFKSKKVLHQLDILQQVGLGYLELGQPLTTLSGGESQRIKLANELKNSGHLYVLDEPTTGLHMADIKQLMKILNHLVDKGNSVIVIEHNLDVLSQADWIIDLGPEGGQKGGNIIAQGPPENIINCSKSYTGQYLKNQFK